MGLTRFAAVATRTCLGLLPAGYAAKAAHKIRSELAVYGDHSQTFASAAGPIRLSGLGWRGTDPDISILEPETIAWISTHVRPTDVFWDIGANIGVYSVFAAKCGAKAVYAFEPFAATYLQLLRNLVANGVDGRVIALNMALSATTAIGKLTLTSFEPGVTSTLQGHELKSVRKDTPIGVQHILTMDAVSFVERFPAAAPDHIKIDVDGAEPLVLPGLLPLIGRVRSLSIEIEPDFAAEFEAKYRPAMLASGLREQAIATKTSGRNRIFVREAA